MVLIGAHLERSFLYFPERALATTPTEVGLSAEDVWLQADDGVQLYGYWLPGLGQRAVVWFHGNAGNISHRLSNARLLIDCNLDRIVVLRHSR